MYYILHYIYCQVLLQLFFIFIFSFIYGTLCI
nr:MAG TPA_asm: hypothetical protein [Caudoviricetes sp.]DAN90819.1 MAG TPA: hypothetical protein [Bacteriophage sp.]DAZ57127.1 MAG TPA: hypothetical protein [Caudoviricetes sp.]